MANLVTSSEVKEIFLTAREDVTSFINDAHILVTTYLAASGYPDPYMAVIEKYIAAHLVALSDEGGGVTSETTGESETKYSMPDSDIGLSTTRFGRTALSLDTKALLAPLAAPALKAQFRVV